MHTKSEIREQILARRDALPVQERVEKSLLVADHHNSIDFGDPGTIVSGFFPIRSELDLRPLMDRLKKRGARLCLPVVRDKETIIFRELIAGAQMVEAGFGTYAPSDEAPQVDPQVLLMPLAVVDHNGGRIGYGAGHYDRAIAKLEAKGIFPKLIGVAFSCQEVQSVPQDSHDKRLDAILTEEGYRAF